MMGIRERTSASSTCPKRPRASPSRPLPLGTVAKTREGVEDDLVDTEEEAKRVSPYGLGNVVIVDHGEGWQTIYGHMRKGSLKVQPGDSVAAGTPIGEVGLSGLTQFPHVHFEVRHNGKLVEPFTGGEASAACVIDPAKAAAGTLWTPEVVSALASTEARILEVGFAGAPLDPRDLEVGLAPDKAASPTSSGLVFFARVMNMRQGDQLRFVLDGPGRLETGARDGARRAGEGNLCRLRRQEAQVRALASGALRGQSRVVSRRACGRGGRERDDAAGIGENMVELATVTLPNGVTMEHAIAGDGPRNALFIHGYGDSWYSHNGMLQALPKGWRATAPSLRGHGGSSKPREGYTVPSHADDVIAFMAAKGIGKAVIVGHSMGSLIGQEIAIRRPDLVSHLVLIASATTVDNDVVHGLKAAVADLTDPVPRQMSHDFQSGTCVNPMGPGMTLERVVDESAKIPARVWIGEADALIGYRPAGNDGADLARIKAPTLVIWGVHDGICPRDEQEKLVKAIPGARLVVHETSGHAVNWEFPEWTMGEVARFVM